MPPLFLQPTPAKPARPDGDIDASAKLSPGSPSKPRYLPQTLLAGDGPGMPNDDAKEIAQRRRARQSMTPTKPLAKFDSICQDSKLILNNMAGMFSPKKGETETPEASPLKIQAEIPPVTFPVKKDQGEKDRRDHQERRGQEHRRKKVVNPGRIRRPARSPADPIPGEESSKRRA